MMNAALQKKDRLSMLCDDSALATWAVWHYARTREHGRYKHTCSLSLYLSFRDDPQPGPVTGLVNWSRLTQISPANLVVLHAPPPSCPSPVPLPPTGFSQGEGEIKQLVVTGDVLCTTLGLEESCWPPHVIGI